MKLNKSAAILAAFLSLPTAVLAQLTPGGGGGGGTFTWPGTAGNATGGTTTGGTMPYVNAYIAGGTLTTSIAGFEPTPAYAQLTVGATSSRVGLPTNTGEVVVYNTGANPAFVQLGNSSVAATASNDVIPAGGWMAFSVGPAVDIAAIETAGPTALNISGGAGIPTGSGGGSSGSSGSNGVAQGSTTSGQLGPLNQVATLTAPPSYSNATTNPLTANTLGGLRVSSEWNSADVYSAPGSITTASTYTGFPAGTAAGSVVRLFNVGPSQLYYTQSTSSTTPSATTAMAQLDPYSSDAIVVNPGMSGISAITRSSGQTAGLNMELGTGTSHMTGGPINLAVAPSGITSVFYDVMGGLDNGNLARAVQVTAPGTSASNYAMPVQGVTAGVPMPVSASTLPLPTNAATAANQEVTAAGTTAASAQAIQGVTGGVPVPVSGSFSASFSQFAPNGNYSTPLTVGSSSTRTALPAGGGTTVAVYNTGSNAAFVQLGSSSVAATASDDQVAPGGFLCLAVGSNADIAAIETAGATALNISGGSGGCAGSGGGGGGGTASANGFQPTTQGTQISATTIGVTGSLPTGTSGVAQDVGSYPAYCQFGSSATGITSGHYFNGSGAQWAYLVPSGATQMTCEGVSGTTQINFYGGTGLGVDTQSAAYGPQDTTLTAIGTISAADAGATSSTWTNGQTVLTWASAPTTSTLQFPGFSGAETGVLVCYGTAAGTFELDTLMDKASPGHYIAQTITQLVGGANPSKAANFTMSGTTTGVIGKVNLTGAWGAQIRATSYSSGSPTCTLGITTNQADTVVANLLPPGKDANIAVTTTTTGTSLVNGVSGQTIHVSAYEFKMGSAGPTTFSLAYSTSTSCTSPTTVAGLFPMSIAGDGETIGDGIADVMTMPAGDTLCAVSTGSSVPVGGHVHYTQY